VENNATEASGGEGERWRTAQLLQIPLDPVHCQPAGKRYKSSAEAVRRGHFEVKTFLLGVKRINITNCI
jgi:hypothetical protein